MPAYPPSTSGETKQPDLPAEGKGKQRQLDLPGGTEEPDGAKKPGETEKPASQTTIAWLISK